DRDDRHARRPALLRGERQRHRRDPPHDPAHPRHPARLTRTRIGATTMATPGIAANAYAQVARITDGAAGLNKAVGGGAAGHDQSFGAILKDALGAVSAAGAKSDAQARALVTGNKANIVDVVTAVAETETAITTLVSVRDRMVAAYEQIMQMPI